MTDWKSPVVIGQAFYAAQALMYICIGIFAYDICQYFLFDINMLFVKRQRRWPQLPYILSKIFMIGFLCTSLIFITSTWRINCQATMEAIETQMGFVAVSSSVLLAFRAVCVFNGKTRTAVSVLLAVMTLGLLAAWMEGVTDIQAEWVAQSGNSWTEGACNFTGISENYAIKYIVTIVFDFVVMLLTVVGVVRMNSGSRIGTILVKQGFQYFLATFLINSLVAGLTLANLNPVMSLICAIPSATVCVMCATRLYVNLAEEAKPRPDGTSFAELSGSSMEKFSRFFRRTGQLHPSFAGRSGATASGATAVSQTGVNSLSYTGGNVHPTADAKSFGTISMHDDVEAQRPAAIVSITEERTVSHDPMPEHLVGVLESPKQSAQAQFPNLSKS
ncbi:hypothetical protein PSEUBRA_005177 [Kalmanozyma brasiliensis GHG001]|uniref:Transmembrane protein n=1 Tax=Kalmanozyma brasiliensis (strain GHG001) TaxID=1365824 RepID=V5EKP0_KALBG|nr:uncharacterized protein PSEUBRA_005177 [Kalmanozyma brasiliensis GHG001]EST05495.1 hypothetical protein PSEUBRA_005177 [Kalmanozyma brasiliensis GHG001]